MAGSVFVFGRAYYRRLKSTTMRKYVVMCGSEDVLRMHQVVQGS